MKVLGLSPDKSLQRSVNHRVLGSGRWTTLSAGVGTSLLLAACTTPAVADFQISEPIRLPLTLDQQSNPITTIMVGEHEVNVGIDTGGGIIDLSGDVIRGAGATSLKRHNTWTNYLGQKSHSPMFKVPAITIGGQTFRNLVVEQLDEPASGDESGASNSIGRAFLRHFFVVIDYANLSVTLWPSGSSAVATVACGSRPLPMESTKESGLVVVRITTPSGPIRALLDTGAQYSAMPEYLARDRNLDLTFYGQSPPFYKLEALTMAGQEFGSLEFVVLPVRPPKDFQVFLGSNFFSEHVVCLDYENREIRIR